MKNENQKIDLQGPSILSELSSPDQSCVDIIDRVPYQPPVVELKTFSGLALTAEVPPG